MAELCPICKKAIPDLEIEWHIQEEHLRREGL